LIKLGKSIRLRFRRSGLRRAAGLAHALALIGQKA
jgi:hypothetical protein